MCFVCGVQNDASTKAEFYLCETTPPLTEGTEEFKPEKVLLTVAHPQEIHQSYPGRMHGGIISALLDEATGRSVETINPDLWAVTIELQVKFRKPVPLDQTVYIESKITKMGKRAFEGEGYLRSGGFTGNRGRFGHDG